MARPKYKTPKGTARGFVALGKEDTTYGGYKTELEIPAKEAAALIEKLEEVAKEEFGKAKGAKAQFPYREDDNGNVIFKAKANADYPPVILDAKGQTVEDRPNIGPGSVIRLAGSIGTNVVKGTAYVSLYINQVKLLKLVEFGGGDPFGDDDDDLDDDAYVAGPQSKRSKKDDADMSEDDDEDDGNF